LRSLVEQHFRFAASPFKSALESIRVRVSSGSETGVEGLKSCEVEIYLRNGGSLKIRRQDARVEHAVRRVAERVHRSLRSLRARRTRQTGQEFVSTP
jgi:ribosome-associated translation inhibitor RaiA